MEDDSWSGAFVYFILTNVHDSKGAKLNHLSSQIETLMIGCHLKELEKLLCNLCTNKNM